MGTNSDSLLATRIGEHDARFFGTMFKGQTVAHRMLMAGKIVPFQEDIVYVSSRFPILVRYDSTGTVIYARATPGFRDGRTAQFGKAQYEHRIRHPYARPITQWL